MFGDSDAGDFASGYSYLPRPGSANTAPGDSWAAGVGWTGTVVPVSASSTILTFTGGSSASNSYYSNNDIGIPSPFQLNRINFTFTANGGALSNMVLSGNALEFLNDGLTSPVLNLAGSGSLLLINNNVTLSNDLTVTGSAAIAPQGAFAGVVSGTGALIKTGSNILTLSGANTFSGGTLLSEGTLNLNNSQALGAGR